MGWDLISLAPKPKNSGGRGKHVVSCFLALVSFSGPKFPFDALSESVSFH